MQYGQHAGFLWCCESAIGAVKEKRAWLTTPLRSSLVSMATTAFTLVGHDADLPEPILRPSPATGHDAAMLDVYDPDLGY